MRCSIEHLILIQCSYKPFSGYWMTNYIILYYYVAEKIKPYFTPILPNSCIHHLDFIRGGLV